MFSLKIVQLEMEISCAQCQNMTVYNVFKYGLTLKSPSDIFTQVSADRITFCPNHESC